MTLRPTNPLPPSPLTQNLKIETILNVTLKSDIKPSKSEVLELDKNFKGEIDLQKYIDISGPVYDIYSIKV